MTRRDSADVGLRLDQTGDRTFAEKGRRVRLLIGEVVREARRMLAAVDGGVGCYVRLIPACTATNHYGDDYAPVCGGFR